MRLVLLDSGPLGLATNPKRTPEVRAIMAWIADITSAGHSILVPEIADIGVRRELLRAGKAAGIRRLNEFIAAEPDRYLPLTTPAMRLAAELWAQARRAGQQTAADPALDGDVIIAAQALTLGSPEAIVSTTNPVHIARFAPADLWHNILP
jgi:predicted nucleic acid-binding protein